MSVSKVSLLLLILMPLLSACEGSSQGAANITAESTSQAGPQTAAKPVTDQVASADLDIGRALYQDGLGANGEPLTAIVTGDVEILGTQFSCNSCHGISGMGSREASIIVPIIAGPILFSPAVQPKRPAYDIASLATVLRDGITPSGRQIDRLMPRYRLSDKEVRSLSAYLGSLSTGPAPGVDDSTIRFATVVTDNSSEQERNAILAVLKRFAEEKSRQTRLESKRWDRGTTPESRLHTVHRDWILDVWELSGEESGWDEQLRAYYERNPVFAIIGGLLPESPEPLARFCEQNAIPCVLPSTRNPESSEGDLYSLYYSRGLGLEADLIATDLKELQFDVLLQVYCEASAARAADRLETDLTGRMIDVRRLAFDCDEETPSDQLQGLLEEPRGSVIVYWLDKAHLSNVAVPSGVRVYLSSTLIGDEIEPLPEPVSDSAYLVHPYRLPGTLDPAFRRMDAWTRTRNIEIRYPRLQGEAFFAAMLMSEIVKHLDKFYIREYVLDLLGHAQGMVLYLPYYSRPTFGPGQIYVSKGGYILPVVNGKLDTGSSDWTIPAY